MDESSIAVIPDEKWKPQKFQPNEVLLVDNDAKTERHESEPNEEVAETEKEITRDGRAPPLLTITMVENLSLASSSVRSEPKM